jgi:cephalosporin hydroxylase
MKILIDTKKNTIKINNKIKNIYSKKSFDCISELWTKLGWNQKYSYTFTWLGRPIIQIPEDIVRFQELIFMLKPNIIVETGIAHGGTAVLFASILNLINNRGRVLAIDINIRKENLKAIKNHPLSKYIKLFKGSSIDNETFKKVKKNIRSKDKVFVFLDSNHTSEHVYNELMLYSQIVSKNSYIVVCDGVMRLVNDTPRGKNNWAVDNPIKAIKKFLKNNNNFILNEPDWLFNESKLNKRITHSPMCFIKKIR